VTVKSSRTGKQGTLFVLSGPSGVGKGCILEGALPRLTDIARSVSVTTRPPRPDEVDGRDYWFRTASDFAAMVAGDELLEWAEVHGHQYGTPRGPVEASLAAGQDVVLEIDVQGALQVREHAPEAVLIFAAPPSWGELARRLHDRATETEDSISRRLEAARQELAVVCERPSLYGYIIINDALDDAVERFRSIVVAERSRPDRLDLSALESTDG
jgi:guanylate kinase